MATINTPTGEFFSTKPLKDFATATTLATSNYLVGLIDTTTNQGLKITLGDALLSLVSSDTGNTIQVGSDGKLSEKSGLTVYSDTTTYGANVWVLDNQKIYNSLQDGNLGNPTSDTDYWGEVELGGGGGASRNIGEIVASTIPLTDAGLHLLDGTVIQGSGIYSAFVDYIAELYSEGGEERPVYDTWTQPTLTANGTMGGSEYACAASSYEDDGYGTYPAYQAFDSSSETQWGPSSDSKPQWLTFYSSVPLNPSNVYLNFGDSGEAFSAGEIQGSNNNSTWTTLSSFSGNSASSINRTISTNENFQYIRFYGTATTGSGWGKIREFVITAREYKGTTTSVPCFCTEAEWQQSVSTYGVCGKFVYDSVNNTVRLPLIEGFTEGTIDTTVLGDLTEAGLPNITGSTYSYSPVVGVSGTFSSGGSVSTHYSTDVGGSSNYRYLDASNSSSMYGNSGTVQPQSIKVLYYIVVATSTKTDIQVDIDEIATDLNMKVDKSSLVEAHVVVETYQNGTSWYYVRDDKFCVQGGACTSGSAITFLKPFSSTNYTLTPTYSTKTSTGFTPSQTGGWIACGYIA